MKKKKKALKKADLALDTTPKKKRGRPGIRRSEVAGRAYNYGFQLEQCWSELEGPLLSAQTPEEVTAAFQDAASFMERFFVPQYAGRILAVLKDSRFPKRREARIRFLADSLGGADRVSPRRSRDICAAERTKRVFRIIRREYYVECTCGYKGPSLDEACRKCGAKISGMPATITFGLGL